MKKLKEKFESLGGTGKVLVAFVAVIVVLVVLDSLLS